MDATGYHGTEALRFGVHTELGTQRADRGLGATAGRAMAAHSTRENLPLRCQAVPTRTYQDVGMDSEMRTPRNLIRIRLVASLAGSRGVRCAAEGGGHGKQYSLPLPEMPSGALRGSGDGTS